MISLRQLQQFLAVADTMSFRRAAERLNMAQPPLTAAIRQMEQEIGVRLFERSNRISGLTAAGEVLRQEAGRAIAQAERAVALARRAGAGEIGSLRIGFVLSAVRGLLPDLVARFRDEYPAVELQLVEAPSARQVAALLDDRLDVGIVALPLPPGAEGRIEVQTLAESRLVAAIPARDTLSAPADKPLALAELSKKPWILFPSEEGPGLHAIIQRACAEAGFVPQVAQRAIQTETIIGLVAAGLGVALVPAVFGETGWDGVTFRELMGAGAPVPYGTALAWRVGNNLPVVEAFVQSCGQSRLSDRGVFAAPAPSGDR